MQEPERLTRIVRLRRGGRITIPVDLRRQLGIDEETWLQLTLVDGELHIRPVQSAKRGQGSAWLKELYELFAPVREAAAAFSEQEIDDAIDQAVAAARTTRAKPRSGVDETP